MYHLGKDYLRLQWLLFVLVDLLQYCFHLSVLCHQHHPVVQWHLEVQWHQLHLFLLFVLYHLLYRLVQ